MCLQPFHWPSIAKPSSCDEQRRRLRLTEGTKESYPQQKVRNLFTMQGGCHFLPSERLPRHMGAYFLRDRQSNERLGGP